jgi:regulator of replication initiation timing
MWGAAGPLAENTKLAKVAVARGVDLEPIDRLEEKVRMLVGMIDRLRAESARASEDNARLARELESLRNRVAEAEGTGVELSTLREERDLIRTRVTEMLEQIETLNL